MVHIQKKKKKNNLKKTKQNTENQFWPQRLLGISMERFKTSC